MRSRVAALIAKVASIAQVIRRVRPMRNASSAPPMLESTAMREIMVAKSVALSSNAPPLPRQNTRKGTIQERMAKSSAPWPA